MILITVKAWQLKVKGLQQDAAALAAEMAKQGQGDFRRVYLFSLPLLSGLARKNRGFELFNKTCEENTKELEAQDSKRKLLFLSIPLLLCGFIAFLCYYPGLFSAAEKSPLFLYRRIIRGYLLEAKIGYLDQWRQPMTWVGYNYKFDLGGWSANQGELAAGGKLSPAVLSNQGEILAQSAEIQRETVGAWNEKYVTVVFVKGSVTTATGRVLAVKDVVREGTVLATGPGAFVKLVFADQTQLNVSANSRVKIEQVGAAGETSFLDLLGGELRAMVTKRAAPSKGSSPDEKMIIRTKYTSLGIKGTDFNFSFDESSGNTDLLMFEGIVNFAKLANPNDDVEDALRNPQKSQTVSAGMKSSAAADALVPSVPLAAAKEEVEKQRNRMDFFDAEEAQIKEMLKKSKENIERASLSNIAKFDVAQDAQEEADNANAWIRRPAQSETSESDQERKAKIYDWLKTAPQDLAENYREFPDKKP